MENKRELTETEWLANQLGLNAGEYALLLTTIQFLDQWVEYIQIETKAGKVSCWDTIFVMGEPHIVDSVWICGKTGYVVTEEGEVFADYFITRIEKYRML